MATVEADRAHLDSFPARPSLLQMLGFLLLILIYVVGLPILRVFQLVWNSLAQRVSVWK